MNGLIGGILRGTGQTMQQIGAKNMELNIADEKAAAEEARQMRLIEVQQAYAVQNRAADQEFQLGKSVLDNQLRGEQQDKEFAFRKEQQAEEIEANKQIAGMRQREGSRMSPAQEREYNLMVQRDAAITAGDAATVKKIDQMLGTKNEKSDFKVISEDPVTGMKEYGMMTPEGLVRVPVVGEPSTNKLGPTDKKTDPAPNWRNYVKPNQQGASGGW